MATSRDRVGLRLGSYNCPGPCDLGHIMAIALAGVYSHLGPAQCLGEFDV